MILGMSLHTFTVLHVIISLIAIVAGLVVLAGMLGSQRMRLRCWPSTAGISPAPGAGFMW